MRKLISQNKISFLQTSYGAPSEALIPILQQNKILTFNGGGASPKQLFGLPLDDPHGLCLRPNPRRAHLAGRELS